MESPQTWIVVGGSPNILNYGLGEKIDERDKIIRVNSCNVEGYEKLKCRKEYKHMKASLNPMKTFDEKRWGNFYFPEEIRDNEVWFRVVATYKQYMIYINKWFGVGMNYRILSRKGYGRKDNIFTNQCKSKTT